MRVGRFWHMCGRPVVHDGHNPHAADVHAITSSPGRKSVTSAPTASTTPDDSWPNTVGTPIGNVPSMQCRSLWHSPAAFVCTSTSWGPIDPTSRSVMSSQPGHS